MWYAHVDLGSINAAATPDSVERCAAYLLADGSSSGVELLSPESDDAVLRLIATAYTARVNPAEIDDQLASIIARDDTRAALVKAYSQLFERGGLFPAAAGMDFPAVDAGKFRWRLLHSMGDRCEWQRSIPVIEYTMQTASGAHVTFQCTPDEAAEFSALLHSAIRAPLRLGSGSGP